MVKTRRTCPKNLRGIAELWRDHKLMAAPDQWEMAQQEIHDILQKGDIVRYNIALREFNRIYSSKKPKRVK